MLTHRTHERGQVMMMGVVFMMVFLTMLAGMVGYGTSYARFERVTIARTQALALAEAGIDKAIYELNNSGTYTGETDTPLGAGTFSISILNIDSTTKRVTATGYVPNSTNPTAVRVVKANIAIDTSIVSFRFAIQSGNGGFDMSQSSSIVGNVYSSGPVIGNGSAGTHCNSITGYGNCIFGDVVSSGPNGLVYGVVATSSIRAHTIGDGTIRTTVGKNVYYATSSTNVFDPNGDPVPGPNTFPGSTDLPSVSLPISDAQILQWEQDAAHGGTFEESSCDSFNSNTNTCTISSSRTIGPKKIPFNLLIKGSSAIITVTGPLWVTGNIEFSTGPTIKMDSSLGSQNVAVIADNQGDRNGSGVINIGQTTQFQGSGAVGSYVFMVSWNTSGESGVANNVCSNGSLDAICMSQSSSALVAYASHGQITFSQSAAVKSATAYKIVLTQSASVTYDTGLPSTLFESGSGGSWSFLPGTYAIIQ